MYYIYLVQRKSGIFFSNVQYQCMADISYSNYYTFYKQTNNQKIT